MPFQKGNRLGKPGNRGGGRPPKTEAEIKQAAAEIAKEFIESNIKPVLNNYLRLANGWLETRYSENGTEYDTFCYDGPTTRHFVDKVLPDGQEINQGPTLNVNILGQVIQQPGSQSDLRTNSLQIRIGGNNGQNGNGSHGA